MKLKVDKTIVASVALHVLVIGWGLITFSTRALEVTPEALPVDIISSADLSKMTAGLKNGEKDKPKPLVEKVADAKPVDEAVGKIDDKKKEVVTSTSTPEPPPKPVEKKVDVKPKEEPKQAEKKPEPQRGSDRRSAEIGRGQEAETEAGSQGRAAAAAKAEGARVRSVEDREPARQARSDAAVDHGRCAQPDVLARHAHRQLRSHRRDLEGQVRLRRQDLLQLPL